MRKRIKRNIDVHAIEQWAIELTKRERAEAQCPIINKQKKIKRMSDYEAYNIMHSIDGIVGKSVCARRL